MTEAQKQAAEEPAMNEAEIAAWLEQNPDFFDRHAEVLENLKLSHSSGNAISLVERQISVLRETNGKLQSQLRTLLDTARVNEDRVGHLNKLASGLLRSHSAQAVLEVLNERLHEDFNVDAVSLGLRPEQEDSENGLHAVNEEHPFAAVLDIGKPWCGELDEQRAELIFGEAIEGSGAAAPLVDANGQTWGVLIVASKDAERFQPHMGTLFLELVASLTGAALESHLGND